MKNQGYVYANKALESAVRDLKSSFFDIFYHSQGTLLMLMTQLDELEVENQSLKEEAVDLINSQGTLLSESMALVEDLIRSIKKIDNNGKKIDKFNRSYVISRSKQFTKVEGPSVGVAVPVAEVTTEVKTEPVTEAVTEVQTEPVTEAVAEVKTEPVTEAVTEVQTEPVTEAVTEVQTEPVTEAVAEVQTEPVTEAVAEAQTEPVTEAVAEVQTEPVTEAVTEVQTEPVTEAVAEVQTEPVTEAVAEVQVEESTEVSTVSTGLELDPNAPVEEATEPSTEKQKKYIADTPEGVVKDLKQALLTMPGMENLKFDNQGNPDFSSVLPQNVLDDFSSKFGFQVSVKKSLNKKDDEMDDESVTASESTVELPFAMEPVIPTPAPPAPPAANSINQGELTTEAVVETNTEPVMLEVTTEATTEVATEAVIPGATVAMPEATTEATTEVATEAVIPGATVAMPEATTEATTEAATEAVIPGATIAMPEATTEATTEIATEAVIPGATIAMPEATTEATTEVATEAVIPGATIAMPEATTEATTEAATEASTDLAMAGIQVAMPTEDVAIEGQILPFGEVSTEAETEPVTEAATEATTEDNTVRRFVDQSVNVKAMLVSDSQYNKLAGSRVTQEAVLTFKRILPEKGHNGTHLVTVDSTHTETAAVPTTENMTADDKNRTIEAMMVDANNLYNAGKIAEAQALYDKISEINKTLVKN